MASQFRCRWALLSLSAIASTFVDDILLPRDDSDTIRHVITCVSTTGSENRARSWLTERNVPDLSSVKIFTSYEEMLKAGDFDIVYVSTPHSLHYLHASTALDNKRNVLLEKPATINVKQFERLVQKAKSQNVVLMEAMWTRYLPATVFLQRELLPTVGQVKRIFADLSVPIVSDDLPRSSRLLDKRAGAGALLDMGVYALAWIDIASNGNRSNEVVYANTVPYDTGKELIDDINTVVVSDGASVGIVTTSLSLGGSNKHPDKLAAPKIGPAVRIEAEKAQITIPFILIRPQEFRVEWYDAEHLDEQGHEKVEVIKKPVDRGWGLWYQADLIAAAVRDNTGSGLVIDEERSRRVLSWLGKARELASITYDEDIEAL
ncbi:hypothetical protein CLAIMM_02160 [Cladophialophora immunda]|nr:hypothetical protein CLAIMM_02160 [Cladophialophora immunda]